LNKYVLKLAIENKDAGFLRALAKSLEPDIHNLPHTCKAEITLFNESAELIIECREINDLRALFNSFYSIVSMILHLTEELES
ncbi:MAG: KEOPS complex subunit Pcc1, partial [Thermoprotei archaeon]